MNGIEWMMTQLDKKEFEQPESDPAAWDAAQLEYGLAVRALRRTLARPAYFVERLEDPDAD